MIRILAAEKKPEILQVIVSSLEKLGYAVKTADSAEKALEIYEREGADLIAADILCGGCELCARLRQKGDDAAFLILAEDLAGPERRRIFRSGADGYLELPPDNEELQMRVRNLLWRCHIEDDAVLTVGDCRLCAGSFKVETPSGTIELRRMEFMLLEKLLSYPGRIFTRNQLLDDLWGFDSSSSPRTVDTHVKQLRKKLKGIDSIRIQTVRGLGYRAAVVRKQISRP